jgi:hypothetical protein
VFKYHKLLHILLKNTFFIQGIISGAANSTIRVTALSCFASLATSFDKELVVSTVLPALDKILSLDRSPEVMVTHFEANRLQITPI